MADITDWLIINRCPGLGAARISDVHHELGSAKSILDSDRGSLRRLGVTDDSIRFLHSAGEKEITNDLDWLDQPRHHLVTLDDPDYPALLGKIADPPPVLFIYGNKDVLTLPQFAVVGSRNPTPIGRDTAHEFSRYLAISGLVITSGLALGIDAAAHRGALASDGITVAVCGTGPDRVYPPEHMKLADRISERGAIISEFPTGTPPRKTNFPRRNRIISGMALGTLVVEAAQYSGSLITARLAAEQGREVFAIPGSIHSARSRGCHRLIREGAKLVESAQDIFDELGAITGLLRPEESEPAAKSDTLEKSEVDPDYQRLLDVMDPGPVSVDALVELSGLTAEEVSSMLLIMELEGHVESTPDGKYGLRLKRK